ncbi:hypothetical protein K443DRAFT_683018, partial [Laccaria amethystina LaAM-08-1]
SLNNIYGFRRSLPTAKNWRGNEAMRITRLSPPLAFRRFIFSSPFYLRPTQPSVNSPPRRRSTPPFPSLQSAPSVNLLTVGRQARQTIRTHDQPPPFLRKRPTASPATPLSRRVEPLLINVTGNVQGRKTRTYTYYSIDNTAHSFLVTSKNATSDFILNLQSTECAPIAPPPL